MIRNLFPLLCIILGLACLGSPVMADSVTIVFDDMPEHNCGDSWLMEGLSLSIIPLSEYCISVDGSTGWTLNFACVDIQARHLLGLSTITLEFTNYVMGSGAVYVYLMDVAAPLRLAHCTDFGNPEIMILPVDDPAIERVRIIGEAFVFHSASFDYDSVPNSISPWGSIKAMFR